MASALEDYMKRMGLGSNTTGSLGLSAPPPPEIPKFTALGNRLAARGGFGDQPGELKTIDELKKLSPQEIEKYKKDRAKARNLGIRESLVAFGESLQGQPGYQNLLERQKARQLIDQNALAKQKFYEAYAAADPRTKEMMNQFIGSELDWLEASKTYSAKKLFGEEKERKVLQRPDGYYYYVDTGERVFATDVQKPPKEKTISDYVADIAKKINDNPNYKLTEQDQRILQVARKADPFTMAIEDIQAGAIQDFIGDKDSNLLTYPSLQAAINAGLKKGDKFKGTDGVTYQVP
jgi:hypothetical protein